MENSPNDPLPAWRALEANELTTASTFISRQSDIISEGRSLLFLSICVMPRAHITRCVPYESESDCAAKGLTFFS